MQIVSDNVMIHHVSKETNLFDKIPNVVSLLEKAGDTTGGIKLESFICMDNEGNKTPLDIGLTYIIKHRVRGDGEACPFRCFFDLV